MTEHIRKSFDRIAAHYNPAAIQEHHDTDSRWCGEPGLQIRCVPWPEGAPDPATVPHAGERVTYRGSSEVYVVVHGIPTQNFFNAKLWSLWIVGHDSAEILVNVDYLRPHVEPQEEPEERTYTEAEIREVFKTGPLGDEFISALLQKAESLNPLREEEQWLS